MIMLLLLASQQLLISGSTLEYIKECMGGSENCDKCQGDCDNHNDCKGSLRCFFRRGFEPVPGCTGEGGTNDRSGMDVCYDATISGEPTPVPVSTSSPSSRGPRTPTVVATTSPPSQSPTREGPTIKYTQECSNGNRCERCKGDCDSDNDCRGALKCYYRSGFEPVPGCIGEGGSNDRAGMDVCYSTTDEPTVAPTIPPTVAPIPSPTSMPVVILTPTSLEFCQDSPLRFKTVLNNAFVTRNCTWAATRATNYRCGLVGVRETCPLTCNACNSCTDSPLRFKMNFNNTLMTRDCEWVKTKSTNWRCGAFGMNNTCRDTCGTC